ncbi:hypothetical protein Hanom_Chr02g00132691 [Helianthus anomalus]
MTDAEEISKIANALPLEWNEALIELKKDNSFSRFTLNEFVNKLEEHKTEIKMKNLRSEFENFKIKDDERIQREKEKNEVQNGEVKESSVSTNETSCSEPLCSKCEKSRSDNVKLLRDVESLTLESKNFIKSENDLKN